MGAGVVKEVMAVGCLWTIDSLAVMVYASSDPRMKACFLSRQRWFPV